MIEHWMDAVKIDEMIKTYFKLAWRNLVKNKVSSLVNIGGLALGLSTCILILLVVLDEFSYNKFHKNLSQIYLVMKNQEEGDGINSGSSTAGPLAQALRSGMPEVIRASRLAHAGDQLIRTQDKLLYEEGIYTEPSLFSMMSFNVLSGDPVSALKDGGSIVITRKTALALYGNVNAIGKIVEWNNKTSMQVAAVIEDIPSNSSIQFDIAFPFSEYEKANEWLRKWDDNRIQTWVMLEPQANLAALNLKLTRLLFSKNQDKTESLFLLPFKDLRLHNRFVNGRQAGGRIYIVMLLTALGAFILLLACINFMNIATARSELRGKEVGVRKVMGASREMLILQFLSESVITAFLALLLAVCFSYLLLPYFNQFISKNLSLSLQNGPVLLSLLLIGIITGLMAGTYPAVFLSRFNTIKVLKGIVSRGKRSAGFRRALVTIQFMISIFLIITTIVIFNQINYVRHRPMGYEMENMIDISANQVLGAKFESFKNAVKKIPGVTQITASSDNLLNYGASITGLDWPGKIPGREISIIATEVGYQWTQTAGVKMLEGRDFSPAFGTDSASCLINQKAVQVLGLKEPVIGQKLGGKPIVGVFRDFVFNNPSGTVAPMMVSLNTGSLSHFLLRIQNNEHWQETISRIGAEAKKLNPGYPFEFVFLKESYQQRFDEMANMGTLATVFAGMAIIISCLGLFGLSIFVAERRSRELSIRKILGAGTTDIWITLSTDFLKPVVIAFCFIAPISVWTLSSLLSSMEYHTAIKWWVLAASGLIALTIALLTVSYQGLRSAWENPIKKLRAD